MSVYDFPSIMYFQRSRISTEPLESFAQFTVREIIDLDFIQMWLVIFGSPMTGTETIKLKLFTDSALTELIATSGAITASTLDQGVAESYSVVRFDFNGERLNTNDTYFLTVETTGLTKDANNAFIGWQLDWPFEINANSETDKKGVKFALGGYI